MFTTRPSPKLAYILTLVFMVGTGLLMCLTMILGRLYLGSPQRREGRIDNYYFSFCKCLRDSYVLAVKL